MKTTPAILALFLLVRSAVLAQITLTAGQSYTYSFTSLALSKAALFPESLIGHGQVYLSGSSFDTGTVFRCEMFEDANAGSLVFSETVTVTNALTYLANVAGTWLDQEGAVRV